MQLYQERGLHISPLINTFHSSRKQEMSAPACKKNRNFGDFHCTSQPLCNESQGKSWQQLAKSSAAKVPLLELTTLLVLTTLPARRAPRTACSLHPPARQAVAK